MNNKKGFQVTIGMLVVIILSLVLLTTGVSLFYKGFNQAVNLRENVESSNQEQLENLLTSSDALLAIPFTDKTVDRGDYVDFDLGIHNELGVEAKFYVCVSYSGSSADYSQTDMPNYYESTSSNEWLLMSPSVKELNIANNDKGFIPMRFKTPKKILKGQYVFNIVVKYWDNSIDYTDPISHSNACSQNYGVSQYASTQKVYITIK